MILDTILNEGSIEPLPVFAYAESSFDGTFLAFTATVTRKGRPYP